MFIRELKQPVSRLKGIGDAAVKSLSSMEIFSVSDLLLHYPFRYEDRLNPVPLVYGRSDKTVNTTALVTGHEFFGWGHKKALKVHIQDDTDSAVLLCFGRNFLKDKLPVGQEIRIYGQFQFKFNELQSGTFDFEPVGEGESDLFDKILPVYHLSGSLTQKNLRKAIAQALREYAIAVNDEMNIPLYQKYHFLSKEEALKGIHFPASEETLRQARATLIYEELFHLQLVIGRRALKQHSLERESRTIPAMLQESLREKLPFKLTGDQEKVLEEIREDMESSRAMCRLVQGDVGSGKTLVAFMAALPVIEQGRQAAFMAPTELLARQHAENGARLLSGLGVRIAFLTGNINAENRKHLLEELKDGQIDLIVGTHALFTEDVVFKDLALAIVDEQHRFGVKQRLALLSKGSHPDLLLMTATPIPRTLALTAFGDLDVSTIKTMPAGRKVIETHLARIGNEQKVYDFVRNELRSGRQAYFVYPLIQQSEKMDLKDAESMYHHLENDVFPDFKVGMIHSKIDEDTKEHTMKAFVARDLDILVATSVVEVGVDVPNATIMVIEHAERFGLSALHQLRGRVGRGEHQSYNFLLYSPELTEEGKKRIMVMKENSDGFVISEEDLKLRGPGELTGVRQSGYLKLRIADFSRDADVLVRARDDVKELLKNDPGFLKPENRNLREMFAKAPPYSDDLLASG
ncbi:ATP-dependent DNA helicase RecG [Spirochaeta isovalerica]|uniref:ATP-dependent DNA helicase RecG n=1 Tax=Spirochaeta isovalerica TaxID=150 RepID=A0A841RCK2_9SPIO|nr:ATP-dependent DNA helicase RecG [Spirochaeta isovalerica]MBB6480599.1 ATP-dependent DNA helicase RecG [Spirochaeta isovalerica]